MPEPTVDLEGLFSSRGYALLKNILPPAGIDAAKNEILQVGEIVSGRHFRELDEMYIWLKHERPAAAGLIYDACKRMVSIAALATNSALVEALRSIGLRRPASVDVNFRIDSKSREKYLFGWHQDYWFSMGSRNGVVAWIPLTNISEDRGGLELILGEISGRKLFKVRPGRVFNSYADAVELDEQIPEETAFPVRAQAGDVLLFRFDVLHRSLPVLSDDRSRWTLQARFADFMDDEFRQRAFRPASVSKGNVPYLDELAASDRIQDSA